MSSLSLLNHIFLCHNHADQPANEAAFQLLLAGAQLQRQEAGLWLARVETRQLKARRVEDARDSLAATYGFRLDELALADRRLYTALAIFREDEPIAAAGIARLWFWKGA